MNHGPKHLGFAANTQRVANVRETECTNTPTHTHTYTYTHTHTLCRATILSVGSVPRPARG